MWADNSDCILSVWCSHPHIVSRHQNCSLCCSVPFPCWLLQSPLTHCSLSHCYSESLAFSNGHQQHSNETLVTSGTAARGPQQWGAYQPHRSSIAVAQWESHWQHSIKSPHYLCSSLISSSMGVLISVVYFSWLQRNNRHMCELGGFYFFSAIWYIWS